MTAMEVIQMYGKFIAFKILLRWFSGLWNDLTVYIVISYHRMFVGLSSILKNTMRIKLKLQHA